jgi:hypothetical protein
LFSGEKYFNVNQVISSQTDRYITNKKAKAAISRSEIPSKVKADNDVWPYRFQWDKNGASLLQIWLQNGGLRPLGTDPEVSRAPLDQLPQQRGCRLDAGWGSLPHR